ncbi:MAG TPA: heavy metal translocating P-type ATPase [Terriglobales bacterium]|nr:heavy metal translocating P-type ATPase [Terriglobales bacterium]
MRRLSLPQQRDDTPIAARGPRTWPGDGAGNGADAGIAPEEPGDREKGQNPSAPAVTSGASLVPTPTSQSRETYIALLAAAGIAAYFALHYPGGVRAEIYNLPLYLTLAVGGLPLLIGLTRRLLKAEFGSDLLAGISILSSVLLGEYLVGSIIVLMLSGGAALEQFATRRASSVLDALAKRMPQVAHRKSKGAIVDAHLQEVGIGDLLVVFPHEICPVDGVVVEGHGVMDESYLTGEPYEMSKTPGSKVLSGAINGDTALTIQAEALPVDSRYAKIMRVMQETEQKRPRLRRLGDKLGAWYTPIAVAVAGAAWAATGEPMRFLAVVVIATPCPLLISIPVAVIGAISLAARHGIIIKNPAVLEQISTCRTLIFDKTGTLTYGKPALTGVIPAPGFTSEDVLQEAASLEQYSKHPLAAAIVVAAQGARLALAAVSHVSERPGEGLEGVVAGRVVRITGRNKVEDQKLALPPIVSGLECLVFVNGHYAATFRFHDAPRMESRSFVDHLKPKHAVEKVMLVSGDRESEVRYLADEVGITEVHASQAPEQKVAIVQEETERGRTLFLGDGINDAPALMAATVGVAFGPNSDITSEAAGAVIMTTSLAKVDELFHISDRMRTIALQSALGGMALSVVGMIAAAAGFLPALQGAIAQEVIDLLAVLNAVRVALPTRTMSDFEAANSFAGSAPKHLGAGA